MRCPSSFVVLRTTSNPARIQLQFSLLICTHLHSLLFLQQFERAMGSKDCDAWFRRAKRYNLPIELGINRASKLPKRKGASAANSRTSLPLGLKLSSNHVVLRNLFVYLRAGNIPRPRNAPDRHSVVGVYLFFASRTVNLTQRAYP